MHDQKLPERDGESTTANWSESGAENILALQCIHSSRRLDSFWKHRLNTKAALNDSLRLAA